MHTMSATRLRSNLFKSLRTVAGGGTIRISTKWGNAILKHDSKRQRGKSAKTLNDQSKIPGRIVGTLDDADRLLREYIQVP